MKSSLPEDTPLKLRFFTQKFDLIRMQFHSNVTMKFIEMKLELFISGSMAELVERFYRWLSLPGAQTR